MDRDFKGIWIPKDIWEDDRLTALDKMILAEVDSLDHGDGCFASNEYLATFCGCSMHAIRDSLAKLRNLGLLETVSFDGRNRKMQVALPNMARQTAQNLGRQTPQNLGSLESDSILNKRIIKESNKNNTPQAVQALLKNYPKSTRDLLNEWLKVRTKKRSPNTEKAVSLNLSKLDGMARDSGLTVDEYLAEVIRRCWAAFYPIPQTKKPAANFDQRQGTNYNDVYEE